VKGHTLIVVVIAAASLVGSTPAATVDPQQRAALKALETPRVTPPTAARGRAEIHRAARLAHDLPSGRREHVRVALAEVASFKGLMSEPRALALIGELRANDDYFAVHYAPQPKTDIADADGIVYRYFAGRCFEFHPLANFGALNARVAAGDADGAQRLADGLRARAVHERGGGIGWEYTFPFSGARAPWLSGMAQAVAAQAFARAAQLVPAEESALMAQARAAYQAIPGRLLTSVAAGPWIRLYSFTSLPVLNAQLQAAISLQSYADASDDADAASLAARMRTSAAATLPQFDTGYWSYYSLPHEPSPLDYHEYVVQLLKQLAPADRRFADAATRFAAYEAQPPAFQLAPGSSGALTFWLSKPATVTAVTAVTAAGAARRVGVAGGWHTLSWATPKRAGAYAVHVTATDAAGNTAAFDSLPFVRATSTLGKPPPRKTAAATIPTASAFDVGATVPDVTQAAVAAQSGLSVVRLQVTWPVGAAAVDPTTAAALQQLPANAGALVELIASPVPADDTGRAALAEYAASLVAQVHTLRTLVLGPAPTGATGAAYTSALAAISAALPTTPLGLEINGATDPARAVASLAGAPVAVVLFRPAPARAAATWTTADLQQLASAFPDAPVVIDGVPAPFGATLKSLSCTAGVAGVLFDRVTDATRPALRATVTTARRGAFVCPGVSVDAQPTVLVFPTAVTSAVATAVSLACNRDCLYLVTLEGPDGAPIVAKRGALDGGVAARIALPKAKLVPGSYKVDVRLVARVNPGAVTRYVSDPLAAS
jgi:D-glucuronyl C5-epimerase C-terminus